MTSGRDAVEGCGIGGSRKTAFFKIKKESFLQACPLMRPENDNATPEVLVANPATGWVARRGSGGDGSW